MKKNYTLAQIAQIAQIEYIGDPETIIESVSQIDNIKPKSLVFIFDQKYLVELDKLTDCTVLLKKGLEKNYNNVLISDNPKYDMAKILKLFEYSYEKFYDYQNVYIGKNVIIGDNVSIAPFSYIGQNSNIGDDVTIMSNSFIGDNSVIGKNTIIYPTVNIMSDSIIGENVIIQSNSVIGSDGYGYVQLSGNNHFKIPQIGNVIIEDNVEIGSNVCIDRATIGSTMIKDGTKIDNMVHIAHNVKIGQRNLIIAQSGIAGSTTIGDDVIIAGQVGIAGHLEIGDKSVIMGRSGVTKSFGCDSKLSGFPARNHREDFKEKAMIKKIPDLIGEISELRNIINQINDKLKPDIVK